MKTFGELNMFRPNFIGTLNDGISIISSKGRLRDPSSSTTF